MVKLLLLGWEEGGFGGREGGRKQRVGRSCVGARGGGGRVLSGACNGNDRWTSPGVHVLCKATGAGTSLCDWL